MTRHRTFILIVASLVVFAGVSSEAALANSLLSGYGGPGQGNQAILGSALLNGPSGGSGGGGGAGVSSTSAGSASGAAAGGSSAPNATGGRAGRSPKHASGAAAPGAGKARGAKTQSSEASSVADAYAAAERGGAAPSSGTLGLSGADFLLIVLALGTLAFMGVLTKRMTRTSAPGRPR